MGTSCMAQLMKQKLKLQDVDALQAQLCNFGDMDISVQARDGLGQAIRCILKGSSSGAPS